MCLNTENFLFFLWPKRGSVVQWQYTVCLSVCLDAADNAPIFSARWCTTVRLRVVGLSVQSTIRTSQGEWWRSVEQHVSVRLTSNMTHQLQSVVDDVCDQRPPVEQLVVLMLSRSSSSSWEQSPHLTHTYTYTYTVSSFTQTSSLSSSSMIHDAVSCSSQADVTVITTFKCCFF